MVSNYSSVPKVFCQFFIWIVPGDLDLDFSIVLVRKTIAVEEETT